MWEEPFEQQLLDSDGSIVINCPTEDLEREMASILDGLGYHYPNGDMLSGGNYWHQYEEDFCYYVDSQKKDVRRGSKNPAELSKYKQYTKCTFYGDYGDTPEPIGEDELLSILEVRK